MVMEVAGHKGCQPRCSLHKVAHTQSVLGGGQTELFKCRSCWTCLIRQNSMSSHAGCQAQLHVGTVMTIPVKTYVAYMWLFLHGSRHLTKPAWQLVNL